MIILGNKSVQAQFKPFTGETTTDNKLPFSSPNNHHGKTGCRPIHLTFWFQEVGNKLLSQIPHLREKPRQTHLRAVELRDLF